MKLKILSRLSKKQRRSLKNFLLVSYGITIFIGALKIFVEHHSLGQSLEEWTYVRLQRLVAPKYRQKDSLPVVVLDMHKIPGGKSGESGDVTSRKRLTELVEDVVKQEPIAIAIDVDFSTEDGDWVTKEDPKFFNYCLTVRKEHGIPIFLGIYKSIAAHPDEWLNASEYKPLAAALIMPEKDTRRIPVWLQVKNSPEQMPTLSAALARVYSEPPAEPPGWLAWAVQKGEEHSGDHYSYANVLMNYSNLETLEETRVKLLEQPDPNQRLLIVDPDKLRNKLVVIGDAEQAVDKFPVPGIVPDVPGVYLHASAVYTLVSQPLYEFKHSVRFILDLVVSSIIILSVAAIRFRPPRKGERFPRERVQNFFVSLAFILVLLAGVLLARYGNVMWQDVTLVLLLTFLLHPWVEKIWHWLKRRLGKNSQQKHVAPRRRAGGKVMRTIVSVISLLLVLASAGVSQETGNSRRAVVDAFVIDLKGTALRRKGFDDQQPLPLKNGDPLYAGDQVRCESGRVLIQQWGVKKVAITPEDGWWPVPRKRKANPLDDAVKNEFPLPAGRPQRGPSGFILSPRRNSIISPARLVFRWTPTEKILPLTLSLKRVGDEKPFWSETVGDSTLGQYLSDEARRRLQRIQKKNPDADLEFAVAKPDGKTRKVVFRVLSVKGEQALARELAASDKEPGLMRTIRRAYAFSRRQLYNEAAEEYESVLKDFPDSPYLLRAAILTQCRAGER